MQIQDYYNFKANGLNDILSDSDKEKIAQIQEKLLTISTNINNKEAELAALLRDNKVSFSTANGKIYTRTKLALDIDYEFIDLFNIFQSTKDNKIWFLNKKKSLCILEGSEINRSNLYVTVVIDVRGINKKTKMSLNRFLYLIEIGDFYITNKTFREAYIKQLTESMKVKAIKDKIKEYKNEEHNILSSKEYKYYNDLYASENERVTTAIREVKVGESRDIPAEPAVNSKKKILDKKLIDVKTIWNSSITAGEKAELMGWFARHIKNMKIKVVDKGVSDKVISKAYPDILYGEKYREKANSSGWDAASGTILVDSTENAPVETIKKLSTIKHMQRAKNGGKTIFKGNTIHNLDLVLFLLSKYNKYGFKTGKNITIDVTNLLEKEFKENDIEFIQGYAGI